LVFTGVASRRLRDASPRRLNWSPDIGIADVFVGADLAEKLAVPVQADVSAVDGLDPDGPVLVDSDVPDGRAGEP
jgi:hypothetical protein